MARYIDQLTRDQIVAQRAAGTPIPDGSGRIVRNGVIVSAGDVMRSQADRMRNQALEMQTAAYRAPMESLSRELSRLPSMGGQSNGMQDQPGFTSPATSSAMPRLRTQSGSVMPDAVTATDPAEIQRSLAIIRDERTKIGPEAGKDYSDARLAEIMRQPDGAQKIVAEANSVVPMLQRNRQEAQTVDYVTGLDQRIKGLDVEAKALDNNIGKAPVPNDAQKIAALAQVANSPAYADLGEDQQNAIAQSLALDMAQGPWKEANKENLARLEQIRKEQATASGQVQSFAQKGIFPRTASAPAPATAGASTAALLGGAQPQPAGQEQRDLSQARIAAGDAAIAGGVNPGGAANVSSGLSWLPRGAIAGATASGGFRVNGVEYASEDAARAAMEAQQALAVPTEVPAPTPARPMVIPMVAGETPSAPRQNAAMANQLPEAPPAAMLAVDNPAAATDAAARAAEIKAYMDSGYRGSFDNWKALQLRANEIRDTRAAIRNLFRVGSPDDVNNAMDRTATQYIR